MKIYYIAAWEEGLVFLVNKGKVTLDYLGILMMFIALVIYLSMSSVVQTFARKFRRSSVL